MNPSVYCMDVTLFPSASGATAIIRELCEATTRELCEAICGYTNVIMILSAHSLGKASDEKL